MLGADWMLPHWQCAVLMKIGFIYVSGEGAAVWSHQVECSNDAK